ncbi:hypothetical protein A8C56_08170 [Niabella ginsenosidivorans]|uniref:DUF2264 domain-containing protein n=2 Tax=Niabella ginsenosidivorans TaxID=1176587 RepID=A0A1A9I9Q3_9BACT|nr:hypothetical protein A8C56_08170 [Niabella ginsenosidivorans]
MLFCSLLFYSVCSVKAQNRIQEEGQKERAYLVAALCKIADPVLTNLAQNTLHKNMPVESNGKDRAQFSHLEAFGRLLAGMAPWLELGPDATAEGKLRAKYILLAGKALANAVNPAAADFLNFHKGAQALVDAAFMAQGLIRAPKQLWEPLPAQTKKQVIDALKSSRVIKPGQNNWLLFSAMVEAAILKFGGDQKKEPVTVAIQKHLEWYKGDGTYGDGPHYHWDYYNSFVIHPMFLEVLETMKEKTPSSYIDSVYQLELKRARRYAAVQERMISPEGTYPVTGRSLAYRFGAFQALSLMALKKELDASVAPQQVRAALYTVVKRQMEAPGTFDPNGWLQTGIMGKQSILGEGYISTGSLYLCAEGLVFLGLPPSDPLWNGKDEDWTAKKIWKGMEAPIDHAED